MKGFTNKSLIQRHTNQQTISPGRIAKLMGGLIMIISMIGAGIWVFSRGITTFQSSVKQLLVGSVGVIGGQLGTAPEEDEMGQITALIVGVGGEGHRGSYNTDTMMIASYNPKHKAVTFVSVPRDLYIATSTGSAGRVNSYLNLQMIQGQTLTGALSSLKDKVASMMGVSINHYVLVDFKGFEQMIDILGGITVTVPNTIIDETYPADQMRTMRLVINSGTQLMDGDLALKYARTRHSTSDFDRSLRQQQIIQGVINKLITGGGIMKLGELKQQFEQSIITDLGFSQIIGLAKYLNRIDHYFSFVLQADCNTYYTLTQPGCLLYAPARVDFGGASVLLPLGARAGRISYYDNIQQFTYYTIYQQPYLIEGAKILILNGIDKDQLLPGQTQNGVIGDLATELKVYGFNVVGIGNSNTKTLSSQLIRQGTGTYDTTADLLRDFAPVVYDRTMTGYALSGTIFSGNRELPLGGSGYDLSNVDLIMIIGNDYLSKTQK